MRRALVAGNWKMNGSRASAAALVEGAKAGSKDLDRVDIALCPPFVFLSDVHGALTGSRIRLGAQDVSLHASGAYTGEISPAMLKEVGCSYVIVGHSERRTYHGETDQQVAAKMVAVNGQGLVPIVCVGETLSEREGGATEQVVGRQLDALLIDDGSFAALRNSVIAYEPVWAIGTGKTATPEQAQDVHHFIRARIAKRDAALAARIAILYGGSVKADNAAELFAKPDIDGGLIGGASLKAEEFLAICRAANAK